MGGRDIFGNVTTNADGEPADKDVFGNRPEDAQGNKPKDIWGNETDEEDKK